MKSSSVVTRTCLPELLQQTKGLLCSQYHLQQVKWLHRAGNCFSMRNTEERGDRLADEEN